jgi:23S rRNA (uracil1939-C5)-methyltransferase
MLACSYSSRCSGCDWLLLPEDEQRLLKVAHLSEHIIDIVPRDVIDSIEFVKISEGGLRDRMDLLLNGRAGSPRLGLFDRFKTGVVDLEGCPQLSPALEAWLSDFRRLRLLSASTPVSIQRGSVRLRVSPQGMRGVWLDFANVDVKFLLDEGTILREMLDTGTVEIGQRRKRLIINASEQLKLSEPVLEPWFETYSPSISDTDLSQPIPLYCTIGSFTQPGFRANRSLVYTALRFVKKGGARRVMEFGSGIGNFTLPLAKLCERVDAYEVDGLALAGLRLGAEKASIAVGDHLHVHEGNFQIDRREPPAFENADMIFVDPPRSGLMKFLDPLANLAPARRPANLVYVSCFAESFAADARRLTSLGYVAQEIVIVDQFPQSRHYEIVALFMTRH